MTYSPTIPDLTTTELQKHMQSDNYLRMIGNDSTVAENGILWAKDVVYTKYMRADEELDFDNDYIAARAALELAIYYLYRRNEQEDRAADKYSTAIDLLYTKLGVYALDITEGNASEMLEKTSGNESNTSYLKIEAGTADYHGFGGFDDFDE